MNELMVKAAWLYHVEGLTQAQIAERMNLTRRRVNELLSAASATGLVRVTFTSPLAENVELEGALCEAFGLDDAAVVSTPEDQGLLHAVLGRAAAAFLDRIIEVRQPRSIGVGWGATLRQTVQHMTRRQMPHLEVCSMMGGLTRGAEINTFDIVRNFAELLGAKCHYFAAPIYADSEGSRNLIVAQPVFRELLEKAASVDLSVLSVGDATAKSLQVKYGLPAGADIRELAASGAVGDLLGRYIDEEGQPVRHPLNGQVISPDLEDYRKVETRIIASGGTHKRRVIAASLGGKLATALVTDADTARWLLSRGR
ncbi:sugar-binding transcriptional regulator [Phyllobacterium phragmitis]|uniref:Sugar-binding transcriptional regulator n=2 Tax=Phyllobacterium phragmitis TaxID=2670329 RepID=A0ABQ0H5E1_9HYPH